MAKNQDYAQQLGRAWQLHRQGQNDDAIREFNGMLKLSTNNPDALYGLGLAQRSNHQLEVAQSTFQQCLTELDGLVAANPHEDRYQMLLKMAKQRIDELQNEKS